MSKTRTQILEFAEEACRMFGGVDFAALGRHNVDRIALLGTLVVFEVAP